MKVAVMDGKKKPPTSAKKPGGRVCDSNKKSSDRRNNSGSRLFGSSPLDTSYVNAYMEFVKNSSPPSRNSRVGREDKKSTVDRPKSPSVGATPGSSQMFLPMAPSGVSPDMVLQAMGTMPAMFYASPAMMMNPLMMPGLWPPLQPGGSSVKEETTTTTRKDKRGGAEKGGSRKKIHSAFPTANNPSLPLMGGLPLGVMGMWPSAMGGLPPQVIPQSPLKISPPNKKDTSRPKSCTASSLPSNKDTGRAPTATVTSPSTSQNVQSSHRLDPCKLTAQVRKSLENRVKGTLKENTQATSSVQGKDMDSLRIHTAFSPGESKFANVSPRSNASSIKSPMNSPGSDSKPKQKGKGRKLDMVLERLAKMSGVQVTTVGAEEHHVMDLSKPQPGQSSSVGHQPHELRALRSQVSSGTEDVMPLDLSRSSKSYPISESTTPSKKEAINPEGVDCTKMTRANERVLDPHVNSSGGKIQGKELRQKKDDIMLDQGKEGGSELNLVPMTNKKVTVKDTKIVLPSQSEAVSTRAERDECEDNKRKTTENTSVQEVLDEALKQHCDPDSPTGVGTEPFTEDEVSTSANVSGNNKVKVCDDQVKQVDHSLKKCPESSPSSRMETERILDVYSQDSMTDDGQKGIDKDKSEQEEVIDDGEEVEPKKIVKTQADPEPQPDRLGMIAGEVGVIQADTSVNNGEKCDFLLNETTEHSEDADIIIIKDDGAEDDRQNKRSELDENDVIYDGGCDSPFVENLEEFHDGSVQINDMLLEDSFEQGGQICVIDDSPNTSLVLEGNGEVAKEDRKNRESPHVSDEAIVLSDQEVDNKGDIGYTDERSEMNKEPCEELGADELKMSQSDEDKELLFPECAQECNASTPKVVDDVKDDADNQSNVKYSKKTKGKRKAKKGKGSRKGAVISQKKVATPSAPSQKGKKKRPALDIKPEVDLVSEGPRLTRWQTMLMNYRAKEAEKERLAALAEEQKKLKEANEGQPKNEEVVVKQEPALQETSMGNNEEVFISGHERQETTSTQGKSPDNLRCALETLPSDSSVRLDLDDKAEAQEPDSFPVVPIQEKETPGNCRSKAKKPVKRCNKVRLEFI